MKKEINYDVRLALQQEKTRTIEAKERIAERKEAKEKSKGSPLNSFKSNMNSKSFKKFKGLRL